MKNWIAGSRIVGLLQKCGSSALNVANATSKRIDQFLHRTVFSQSVWSILYGLLGLFVCAIYLLIIRKFVKSEHRIAGEIFFCPVFFYIFFAGPITAIGIALLSRKIYLGETVRPHLLAFPSLFIQIVLPLSFVWGFKEIIQFFK
ncbi:MAG: hypothetical protein R3B84_03755 [Zavarzinella sp.]